VGRTARVPSRARHKLERFGAWESLAAVILRHTNENITRKQFIKPLRLEPVLQYGSCRMGSQLWERANCSPNCSPNV
jgi:hypothetical protein